MQNGVTKFWTCFSFLFVFAMSRLESQGVFSVNWIIPGNLYLFKINSRNTRKRYKDSRTTKHNSHFFLVFLLLPLNMRMFPGNVQVFCSVTLSKYLFKFRRDALEQHLWLCLLLLWTSPSSKRLALLRYAKPNITESNSDFKYFTKESCLREKKTWKIFFKAS